MKLFVSSKAGINERLINRVLVGITGLNIETNDRIGDFANEYLPHTCQNYKNHR